MIISWEDAHILKVALELARIATITPPKNLEKAVGFKELKEGVERLLPRFEELLLREEEAYIVQ